MIIVIADIIHVHGDHVHILATRRQFTIHGKQIVHIISIHTIMRTANIIYLPDMGFNVKAKF